MIATAATATAADRRRARSILLLFAALAGTSYIASRYMAVDHHPYMVALHGLFAGAVLMTLIDRDRSIATPRRHIGPVLFVGAGVATTPYLVLKGSLLVTPSLAAVLVISNALTIALFSWLLGRKRFTPAQVAALLTGFAGVVAVSWDQGTWGGAPTGVAYLLATSILIAAMTIVYEPTVRELGAVGATKRNFLVSFAVASCVAAGSGLLHFHSVAQSLLGVSFGLFSVTLPILLFNVGMRLIGAADAANFKLLIPLFALLYGVLLLGETPGALSTAAGGVIVASVAFYQRAARLAERSRTRAA
jgi:drug/metabolite transporter (DMT)-like permease